MQKNLWLIGVLIIGLISCDTAPRSKATVGASSNWENRVYKGSVDSLEHHKSYLSVYSEIYSLNLQRKVRLTTTVSIRNTSVSDSLFLFSAKYYDTDGSLIRGYAEKPVFVMPMETIEIVIEESDLSGGSGANILFEWGIKNNGAEPLFEAIMLSTNGQQGIAFTTNGVKI